MHDVDLAHPSGAICACCTCTKYKQAFAQHEVCMVLGLPNVCATGAHLGLRQLLSANDVDSQQCQDDTCQANQLQRRKRKALVGVKMYICMLAYLSVATCVM